MDGDEAGQTWITLPLVVLAMDNSSSAAAATTELPHMPLRDLGQDIHGGGVHPPVLPLRAGEEAAGPGRARLRRHQRPQRRFGRAAAEAPAAFCTQFLHRLDRFDFLLLLYLFYFILHEFFSKKKVVS